MHKFQVIERTCIPNYYYKISNDKVYLNANTIGTGRNVYCSLKETLHIIYKATQLYDHITLYIPKARLMI